MMLAKCGHLKANGSHTVKHFLRHCISVKLPRKHLFMTAIADEIRTRELPSPRQSLLSLSLTEHLNEFCRQAPSEPFGY